jgi:hypothetical protein
MILVLISTNSCTICWVFPYWQSIYYTCVQCWPLKFPTFFLWPYFPKTHLNMKILGKVCEAWSKSSMMTLLMQLRVKLIVLISSPPECTQQFQSHTICNLLKHFWYCSFEMAFILTVILCLISSTSPSLILFGMT